MNLIHKSAVNVVMNFLLVAVLCLLNGCGKQGEATDTHAGSTNLVTLTQSNFETEVLSSSQPVLVDFWAVWCGPCRAVAPAVAALADEFQGKAKVGKVDVDKETSLAQQYSINAIPALLIFKNGKVVDQMVGVRSKSELKEALNKHLEAGDTKAPPAKS